MFIYAGLSWSLVSSTWFTSAFNFLYVIMTGTSINDEVYFIGYITPPITLFFWFCFITDLKYIEKRKFILLICVIQGIIYEIILLYFIFIDLSVVGYKNGLFNVEFTLPFTIYLMGILIVTLISGVLFGIEALKSESREISLKGKFMIIAFLSFFIGALLDTGIILLNPISLIIIRIILITSTIEFYFGMFLPDWLKKLLISESKS